MLTQSEQNLLEEYMKVFFGYGNLKSDYWFIGMEEGGGNSEQEISSRLDVWEKSGRPTLLDNYDFHAKVTGETGATFDYLFNGSNSRYQPTWGGLIKIILNFENAVSPSLKEVKHFQSENLGRHNSNNCILEVFPLPSPSVSKFNYAEWTDIDYLRDRVQYKRHLHKPRINKLKQLISEHQPKLVLFYSSNPEYTSYWSEISGINFSAIPPTRISKNLNAKFHRIGRTQFVITPHPTYKGISNEFFVNIGSMLRELIGM
jgi:hypothetical protein